MGRLSGLPLGVDRHGPRAVILSTVPYTYHSIMISQIIELHSVDYLI